MWTKVRCWIKEELSSQNGKAGCKGRSDRFDYRSCFVDMATDIETTSNHGVKVGKSSAEQPAKTDQILEGVTRVRT
ncbi:hypothetical protein VTL71DRAFT_12769 [Oculimacula yallundae]|uniref:Uncharacterized protein n=1 Tax=Oculimacula yallundae TaxID=86028 RepID=A0ABR4CNZ5_9HELO